MERHALPEDENGGDQDDPVEQPVDSENPSTSATVTLSTPDSMASPAMENPAFLLSQPPSSGAGTHPIYRRDIKKGSLKKETDISSPHKPLYIHEVHTREAFAELHQLRSDRLLCDVTLIADDYEIWAHKAVLAACSPYFYAMFTCELAESASDRITLQEVDGHALSLLIDYTYTSSIQVTDQAVQNLLPAAKLLQLTVVEEACCDYLQSQLDPSNCLGITAFADLHMCTELHHTAVQYTEQHFSEIVQHDEFFNLSSQQLISLISSDQLSVKNESEVYESVLRWLQHDAPRRSQYVAQVMQHVRLPLVHKDYLMKIESDELIKNSSECKDFLIEALKYHLIKDSSIPGLPAVVTPRMKQRTPVGLPKSLLVLGGQAPKAIRSVEMFCLQDESWSPVCEMLTRRCRCGVAVVANQVYVCGGFNGSLRVRSVDVYDVASDSWLAVQPMEARRSTLGAAVLDGLVYAVGGFDGSSGLNSVECYDPKVNEWQAVTNMSTRRSSVGVGVVRGLLYAVGGYDGASRHCLASVECYNPSTNSWTPVRDMSCRRSGAGVGIIDGLLYAVGGHDGPLVRKSVEYYNPDLQIWTQVTDMHMCRRNAGVVASGGLLYVVGGDDGSANLDSVEFYNPHLNTWTLLDRTMTTGRSYAGVAVVERGT